MYNSYYGFKESPFSIAPNPRYLYMGEQHQEALAHLLYSLETRGGFVLLTGEVGTGKTTVTRCFLEKLPEDTECAYILYPKMSSEELLAAICDELNIQYDDKEFNIKNYIDVIQERLLEVYARGSRTFLVIDEAQNLSHDVLEQVRLLTNLETAETKLLQIILVGQPELRDIFDETSLRQLKQRITARFHLSHLTLEELPAYIKHRLRVAGAHRNPFTKKAVAQVFRLTGGIPRLVNVLCDRALLGGFVQELDRISIDVVNEAAREVFGDEQRSVVTNTIRSLFSKNMIAISKKNSLIVFGCVSVCIIVFALISKLYKVGESSMAAAISPEREEIRLSPELESDLQIQMDTPDWKIPLELFSDETEKRVDNASSVNQLSGTQSMPMVDGVHDITSDLFEEAVSEGQMTQLNDALTQLTHAEQSVEHKLVLQELDASLNSLKVLTLPNVAFARLLSYWGQDVEQLGDTLSSIEQFCSQVTNVNLSCLEKTGDLKAVFTFNRPALLKIDGLKHSLDHEYYVNLIGVDKEYVLLDSDEGPIKWEKSFLEQVWSGEYRLLWRNPPNYSGYIRPGMAGQPVDWLNQKLKLLEEKQLIKSKIGVYGQSLDRKAVFDSVLQEAVKAFQSAYGLDVDGLAGEQTLMFINSLLDTRVPTLQGTVSGA